MIAPTEAVLFPARSNASILRYPLLPLQAAHSVAWCASLVQACSDTISDTIEQRRA
jgi:hypothetical protein